MFGKECDLEEIEVLSNQGLGIFDGGELIETGNHEIFLREDRISSSGFGTFIGAAAGASDPEASRRRPNGRERSKQEGGEAICEGKPAEAESGTREGRGRRAAADACRRHPSSCVICNSKWLDRPREPLPLPHSLEHDNNNKKSVFHEKYLAQ